MSDMMNTQQLQDDEDNVVEYVKEMLLNDRRIHEHIMDKVKMYWADAYGIDLKGPMTDFQEEFICQCQVQLMMNLLAKVMVA